MMGFAELQVGGRQYRMACRDGDEGELVALAKVVDAKAAAARRAIGDTTEPRLLLMASLLLAEELEGMRAAAAPTPSEPAPAPVAAPAVGPDRLDALAAALEDIASSLEKRVASA